MGMTRAHKWELKRKFNTYFDKTTLLRGTKICLRCRCEKREVVDGWRYDLPDGNHVMNEEPECKDYDNL